MSAPLGPLTWDGVGERVFETGVDHGVLYIPDEDGDYNTGVAWNGLSGVTESPSGAEATPLYADNRKYVNLISAEQFGATLEAYTYPDEFAQFDGMATPSPGVTVGQQPRGTFGLCYRTKVGNDVNPEAGYKLHLVYGCQAAPSEKAYATVNDTPEGIAFSWTLTTTPVEVTGMKPTAIITIDSTKVDGDALASLEDLLYGVAATAPALPLPDDVIALFPEEAGLMATASLAKHSDGADAAPVDAGTPAGSGTSPSGTSSTSSTSSSSSSGSSTPAT